jgi:hypothetical protein
LKCSKASLSSMKFPPAAGVKPANIPLQPSQ